MEKIYFNHIEPMEKEVTVVIIQRNLFSTTMMNLNSVYENTDIPFDLLYLDAGSPRHIQQYLVKESMRRKFRYLQSEKYMPPNFMRKKALDLVKTPFVLFLDNDCTVSKGWLGHLVTAAKETGAWLIGPLYLENVQEKILVHCIGGKARLIKDKAGYMYSLNPVSPHLPESDCQIPDTYFESELIEFHCALLNLNKFSDRPPIDEKLFSMHEHNDLCLYVLKHGGKIVIEPRAKVTYLVPPPFKWYDLPVFFVRWSEKWNRSSLNYFKEKWGLAESDPSTGQAVFFGSMMRRYYLTTTRKWVTRLLGQKLTSLLFKYGVYPIEKRINKLLVYKDPLTRVAPFTEFNLTSV